MTTIRAYIRKSNHPAYADAPWCIDVRTTDDDNAPVRADYAEATSHPAAVRGAWQMIRDADRELMAEVHESRASRWNARRKQIVDEALATPCPNIPLIPTAHLHTMEATA